MRPHELLWVVLAVTLSCGPQPTRSTNPPSTAPTVPAPVSVNFSRIAVTGSGEWAGMAFAPNTNKLYAPPLFASCLLVIDPANQTLDTSTICVATEFWSGGSWYGMTFLPNVGKLVATPQAATYLLVVDPVSNATGSIAVPSGQAKWLGAVYAPNVQKAFFGPANANFGVLVYDPISNATDSTTLAARGVWRGLTYVPPLGKVFLCPAASTSPMLIVDPVTNATSMVTIARFSSSAAGWWDFVFVPATGKLYSMLVSATGAAILEVNPSTNASTIHTVSTTAAADQHNAVFNPQTGLITGLPYHGSGVTVFHPETNRSSVVFSSSFARQHKYDGGAYCPVDGRVYGTPHAARSVLLLSAPLVAPAPTSPPTATPTASPSATPTSTARPSTSTPTARPTLHPFPTRFDGEFTAAPTQSPTSALRAAVGAPAGSSGSSTQVKSLAVGGSTSPFVLGVAALLIIPLAAVAVVFAISYFYSKDDVDTLWGKINLLIVAISALAQAWTVINLAIVYFSDNLHALAAIHVTFIVLQMVYSLSIVVTYLESDPAITRRSLWGRVVLQLTFPLVPFEAMASATQQTTTLVFDRVTGSAAAVSFVPLAALQLYVALAVDGSSEGDLFVPIVSAVVLLLFQTLSRAHFDGQVHTTHAADAADREAHRNGDISHPMRNLIWTLHFRGTKEVWGRAQSYLRYWILFRLVEAAGRMFTVLTALLWSPYAVLGWYLVTVAGLATIQLVRDEPGARPPLGFQLISTMAVLPFTWDDDLRREAVYFAHLDETARSGKTSTTDSADLGGSGMARPLVSHGPYHAITGAVTVLTVVLSATLGSHPLIVPFAITAAACLLLLLLLLKFILHVLDFPETFGFAAAECGKDAFFTHYECVAGERVEFVPRLYPRALRGLERRCSYWDKHLLDVEADTPLVAATADPAQPKRQQRLHPTFPSAKAAAVALFADARKEGLALLLKAARFALTAQSESDADADSASAASKRAEAAAAKKGVAAMAAAHGVRWPHSHGASHRKAGQHVLSEAGLSVDRHTGVVRGAVHTPGAYYFRVDCVADSFFSFRRTAVLRVDVKAATVPPPREARIMYAPAAAGVSKAPHGGPRFALAATSDAGAVCTSSPPAYVEPRQDLRLLRFRLDRLVACYGDPALRSGDPAGSKGSLDPAHPEVHAAWVDVVVTTTGGGAEAAFDRVVRTVRAATAGSGGVDAVQVEGVNPRGDPSQPRLTAHSNGSASITVPLAPGPTTFAAATRAVDRLKESEEAAASVACYAWLDVTHIGPGNPLQQLSGFSKMVTIAGDGALQLHPPPPPLSLRAGSAPAPALPDLEFRVTAYVAGAEQTEPCVGLRVCQTAESSGGSLCRLGALRVTVRPEQAKESSSGPRDALDTMDAVDAAPEADTDGATNGDTPMADSPQDETAPHENMTFGFESGSDGGAANPVGDVSGQETGGGGGDSPEPVPQESYLEVTGEAENETFGDDIPDEVGGFGFDSGAP